jgi:hypothetical protein
VFKSTPVNFSLTIGGLGKRAQKKALFSAFLLKSAIKQRFLQVFLGVFLAQSTKTLLKFINTTTSVHYTLLTSVERVAL